METAIEERVDTVRGREDEPAVTREIGNGEVDRRDGDRGSSTTSAPSSSSSVRSSLACSRARVTTIVRPKRGRCSNQEKSRAATSPTTIADGASTPTAAIVASVARVVRCSGRVPQRTAATGVSRCTSTAIERVGDVGDAAGTHEDHERAAGAGERVPVGVDRSLRRILVTGDDRDARRDASVRHRDARHTRARRSRS